MHSACFLRVRSVPLSDSQGFDICFGLHGYHDHVGGVTTSKHGYNIMEVLKNATKYSDLDMSWGPVTRGFAMTPFYIGELLEPCQSDFSVPFPLHLSPVGRLL